MSCYTPFPPLVAFTAEQTRDYMRRWLMFSGCFAAYATNGKLQLITVRSPSADQAAVAMVLGGFGTRLAHGIELNAAGLALWNEAHPS